MAEHGKREKKSQLKKGGIGEMLMKLIPGGLSKSILDHTNKKLKGVTDKKK